MSPTYHFILADHHVCVDFMQESINNMDLLPSFVPFAVDDCFDEPLFSMTVDDQLKPVSKEQRERIRVFDTGNGETVVDEIKNGGYQYIIRDIKGNDCALLQTNKDFSLCQCALNGDHSMRRFGLNNALMLAFAFAGCRKNTLLIHASLVRKDGVGYPFIAQSGTGKSTHVGLWLQHIPGCDMMNDDNPFVRIIDGKPYIYGGPWSGKTPCYRNVKAPLGAVTRIDRAKQNSIERLHAAEAFTSLLPACSSMKWDKEIYDNICNIVAKIVETTPIYTLHCLPDKEAALLCCQTITKRNA